MRRWTPEEDSTLSKEWYVGTTIPEIIEILPNRTETAINARIHRLRLGRRITIGVSGRKNIQGSAGFAGLKKRNCLMCGEKFQTEWKQQWVCNICRGTNLWRNSDNRV